MGLWGLDKVLFSISVLFSGHQDAMGREGVKQGSDMVFKIYREWIHGEGVTRMEGQRPEEIAVTSQRGR